MGEITIYFVGICTFMQDVEGALPGFSRRVVLVNARVPRVINGYAIPPHIPSLRIAANDLVVDGEPPRTRTATILEWELHGCRLEVADAIRKLEHDASFECCIPHLKKLTPDLGPPSAAMVIAAEPQRASCYFELTAGTLSAGLIANGAAVTALNVRTSTESPVLRLRRFHTGEPQEFQLRSGAEVAIMNVGAEGEKSDGDSDFLLHYEVAEHIPPDAVIPQSPAPCCSKLQQSYIIPNGGLGIGPGCSNSNFP